MSLRSKLAALAAAAAIAASSVPVPALAAAPETFVTSANANHWGRSDLRAYLTGYTKTDDTAPLDSTGASNSSGYAALFSSSEYARIQPVTHSTNVLDASGNVTSAYETTDKFYLPSGNILNDKALYWGSEDISANSAYATAAQNDIARFIPVSYWSGGSSSESFLRSALTQSAYAMTSGRGGNTSAFPVYYFHGAVSSMIKVDINNVSFAAAASAAEFAAGGSSGSKTITIDGSSDFGRKTQDNLPDYGMYLKTRSTDEFEPMTVAFHGNSMLIEYEYYGRNQGKYVVVQAYGDDDLQGGTVVYAAAAKIDVVGFGHAGIDVSDWGLANLDGYTVKVWMEDASEGSSLALATEPVTFVGRGGQVERTDEGAVKNLRVFAMANELQTSWGDLAALSESDQGAVLNGQAASATGAVSGTNPTNQKIYFGENGGQPLQFWIAGRESRGEISSDGSTLVLYQAKNVETRAFNQSTASYDGVAGAVTLQLTDGQTASLSSGSVTYPTEGIAFSLGNVPQDVSALSWQYRASSTDDWKSGMPSAVGTWQVRCCAPGVDGSYETTYSAPVTLTVEKGAPAAGDFDFTAPSDLTYDGSPKAATVTTKNGVTGMGAVTLTYYEDGEKLGGAPTDAGTYTVKIDVAEGSNYAAAAGVADLSWTFTIAKAKQSVPTGFSVTDETAAGAADGSVSGLPANAEWRAEGASSWTSVASGSGITGLAPGSYEVRLAGDKNHEPSPAASFEVRSFSAAHGGADVPEGPEVPATGKNDGLAKTSDPAALLAPAALATAGAAALLASRRK